MDHPLIFVLRYGPCTLATACAVVSYDDRSPRAPASRYRDLSPRVGRTGSESSATREPGHVPFAEVPSSSLLVVRPTAKRDPFDRMSSRPGPCILVVEFHELLR